MSIIPGIETAAPERTETSSGSAASPKRFPVFPSSRSGRRLVDLRPQLHGDLAHLHRRAAGVGRDRESGRDRDPERGHLGEVDPLAAEEPRALPGVLVVGVDQAHGAILRHPARLRRAVRIGAAQRAAILATASGCGKTTFGRALAGALDVPSSSTRSTGRRAGPSPRRGRSLRRRVEPLVELDAWVIDGSYRASSATSCSSTRTPSSGWTCRGGSGCGGSSSGAAARDHGRVSCGTATASRSAQRLVDSDSPFGSRSLTSARAVTATRREPRAVPRRAPPDSSPRWTRFRSARRRRSEPPPPTRPHGARARSASGRRRRPPSRRRARPPHHPVANGNPALLGEVAADPRARTPYLRSARSRRRRLGRRARSATRRMIRIAVSSTDSSGHVDHRTAKPPVDARRCVGSSKTASRSA